MRQLKLAATALLRSPAFSIVAVLTLALGIGANVALFTIIDSVVLEPLSYPSSERLVWLRHPVPGIEEGEEFDLSVAGYFHYRDGSRTLDELGAYRVAPVTVTGDGAPELGLGAFASASLLRALGARPVHGRLYTEEEDVPNGPAVVVIGHDYWRRRFGADPGAVGRRIDVNGVPVEIVGVTAPGFALPDQPVDIWMPIRLDRDAEAQNSHYLFAIGRLAEGSTVAAAHAELLGLTSRLGERFPNAYWRGFLEESRFTVKVESLRDEVIGPIRSALWILFGSVGLVLLIACANVANLYLVRAEARRREVALRTALGAGRGDLARTFMTESALLSAAAAVLGVVLAAVGLRLLLVAAPPTLPRLSEIRMDGSSLLFAAAIASLATLVFGGFPLLRARTEESAAVLRDGGRGMTGSRTGQRVRNALVVAQVALALVLLVGAALMFRSFQALRSVEPGFRAEGVLAMEVVLPSARYQDQDRVAAVYTQLVRSLGVAQGVRAAGGTGALPIQDRTTCYAQFAEQARENQARSGVCFGLVPVTPGYFETMGIAVQGRAFESADVESRAAVAVVSRGLAERLWPGEDPIGKGIKPFDDRDPFYRVIGVAEDVRAERMDARPTEIVYYPLMHAEGEPSWFLPRTFNFVVRSDRGDPAGLTAAVRSAVSALDPTIPVANVQPMTQVVARSMVRTSFTLLLLGIAASVALLLGAVGIYGVIAYIVGQRRAEIGVRMALGARAGQVRRLIIVQSLRMALLGIAIGVVAALAATRVMRTLLFEVSPTEPAVFALVPLLLIAVALVAGWVPAARASRVHPLEVLRDP